MKRIILSISFLFVIISSGSAGVKKHLFSYETGYLNNGMKFIVVERKQLPLVSFGLMLKSGAMQESKPGVASLLSSTLIYGNQYMSPSSVVQKLDYLGASVGVSADYDSIEIGASMRASTTERVMKIISRIVRLPVFPKSIVQRFKMRTLAAIKSQKDDIAGEVRMQFYKLIYGNHPYSRNILGSMQSVYGLTRKDLLTYHRKYFVPNNAVAVLVGDITFKKAKKILTRYFGVWKKNKLPETKTFKIPPLKKQVKIINYPTTQGYVRIGHVSLKRNNPVYYKLLLYNAILGGSGFGSRLTQEIREKHGLTYGIISYFYVYRKNPGYFHINFSTKLNKVKFAIKKVYEVIDKYLKNGPSKKEFENIKKYMSGILIMQRETPSQLISKIMNMELYNLKPYFWEKELSIIKNMTLSEVKEAARYIHKKYFTVVVVADTSKVKLKGSDITP